MHKMNLAGAALATMAALAIPGAASAGDFDHGHRHGWHRYMHAPWHHRHERPVVVVPRAGVHPPVVVHRAPVRRWHRVD